MPRGAPVRVPQSAALRALRDIDDLHILTQTRISFSRWYRYRKEISTMWKRLLLSAITVGALLTSVAVAADLSGKWKAEFTTPDGTATRHELDLEVMCDQAA